MKHTSPRIEDVPAQKGTILSSFPQNPSTKTNKGNKAGEETTLAHHPSIMSSVDGQAFLGGDDNTDDDFAALDSMGYSGIMSPSTGFANLTSSGSPAAVLSNSNSSSLGTGGSAMGDGRENGFPGVSGSLFDRIRARTEAEQQVRKQQQQNTNNVGQYSSYNNQLPPQSSQVSSGQSSQEQQQQQQQSAFVSQQQSAFVSQQQQQPPSAFMSQPQSQVEDDYSFNNNNNETTYAAGENFSHHINMAPVHAPIYHNRSNDPYNVAYAAMGGGEQHQQSSSVLARASMAAQSIFGAGISSVVTVGTLAKDKIVAGIAGSGGGSGGGGGAGGGGRSYTNSFLLREDSIEGGMQGFGGGGDIGQQQQPPPPIGEMTSMGGGGASDQAYSMMRYGKTFVEDVYLFVQQLPAWGKGVLGVFVLIGLWLMFG
jgi:hypothetical protein